MTFEELILKSRPEGESPYEGTLLSLDPGHTTGYCVFNGLELIRKGEIRTLEPEEAYKEINTLIHCARPTEVVFEDYRIYSWRAKQHANSELVTAKLIGMIQAICISHGLEYFKQPANVAMEFVTDKRLKEFRYYVEGQRHARDAIRHACYFITFGGKDRWSRIAARKRGLTVG